MLFDVVHFSFFARDLVSASTLGLLRNWRFPETEIRINAGDIDLDITCSMSGRNVGLVSLFPFSPRGLHVDFGARGRKDDETLRIV
jgi:hypothetical protein